MATQVAQGQVIRQRTESLERWQAALERALTNGLEVFTVADSGERMVTSASQLDTLHRTDGRSCTCAAGIAGDPVCQHRAVVRFVMGWLPAATPEPQSDDCAACSGCGIIHYRSGHQERCPSCNGSGLRPDHRLHDAPAVEVVATAA